jgi:hypothetical protein
MARFEHDKDVHDLNKFYILTPGEEVIRDIMLECHHPNIVRHDDDSYSYHEN